MSLAERRWLRITTLCVLYVAQGIPWGFTATTLPSYLRAQGVDLELVGTALSFTTLPYAFKWIWGPIIDTFQLPRFGRRRPWIVFAQAMMALTILAMVTFDLTVEVRLLAWMIFVHTVFNSLQDVAVDALAIDILPDNERGAANGLMYASKYLGGALGGVGMATLTVMLGLKQALVIQSCVLLAIMLVPLFVRERDSSEPPPPRESPRVVANALRQAFSLRSAQMTALLLLAIMFTTGVLSLTGTNLFVGKLGWTYPQYSAIQGGWGLVCGGVCASLAGVLADKLGRRRLAAIASCLLAANWLAFVLLHEYWTSHTFVYVSGMCEVAFQATLSVALIALCMDVSWPKIGGTQFAGYMALLNFSTTLGYQFAPVFNKWWSFERIYVTAAIVQLAVTLLLIPIDPTESRRQLPFPEGSRVPNTGILALGALLVALIGMTVFVTYQRLG